MFDAPISDAVYFEKQHTPHTMHDADFLKDDDCSISSDDYVKVRMQETRDSNEPVCYLNYASKSPLHPTVQEAGFKAIHRPPWKKKQSEDQEVRHLFASLIGAQGKDIAIMPSTAFAITFAANNIKKMLKDNKRKKIVLLQDQMNSAVYPWQYLVDDCNNSVELGIIPYPQKDETWTSAVIDRIDDTILVACLPPLHWSDGTLLDLVKIGEACSNHNVLLVVDATQAVGILPIDVSNIGPAVLASSVHKFLLGPVGMSLVYISPTLHDLWEPLDQHGRSRIVEIEHPSSWDSAQNNMGPNGYSEKFARDARKFDSGGKSNNVLMPMVRAGLKLATQTDARSAQSELKDLCAPLLTWATSKGFSVATKSRSYHLIGIRPPSDLAPPEKMIEICKRLEEEQIFIAVRCGAFRISPYLDTTPFEIQRLIKVLDREMFGEKNNNN